MKQLVFLLVVAVLGSAAFSEAASAAQLTRKEKNAAYGRKIMSQFAECSVKNEPGLSRKFVLTNSADLYSTAEFQKLAGPHCLPAAAAQLQMLPFYYRGALAEELIRTGSSVPAAFNTAGSAPLDWPVPAAAPVNPRTGRKLTAAELQDLRTSLASQMAVGRLGECVVRAAPAGARAVLSTRMDDPSELSALKALAPQIAGCIKAGETSVFNRTNLRAGIAVSYYRLATALPKQEATE